MTTKPFKPIIFNKSKYSTSLLRKMIKLANFTIGCKGPVVFKITPGSKISVSGEATRTSKFSMKNNISNKCPLGEILETTGGWISICPPKVSSENYLIHTAEQLFSTIVHELKHVFDFQTDETYHWDWDVRHSSSERRRRQNWSKRPQEIRAQKQEKDSLHFLNANPKYKVAFENLIIDFAVAMSEKPWR